MKSLFSILVFFVFVTMNGQRLKPFLGGSLLLNGDFRNSSISNINGGLEVKLANYFKPEIETGFYFGSLNDVSNIDAQGNTTDLYYRTMTAVYVGIAPKIVFNFDETPEIGLGYFQIVPIYTISRITSKGNFITFNQNNPQITEEKETITATAHSLGIGIGFNVNLSENNTNALAINISYLPIDFGKSIYELKYSNSRVNNKNQIGLGLKFYFGKNYKK